MLGRDAKMGSVEALRLELVGKTDEQNCDIRFLCSFDCIGYVSLGRIFLLLLLGSLWNRRFTVEMIVWCSLNVFLHCFCYLFSGFCFNVFVVIRLYFVLRRC